MSLQAETFVAVRCDFPECGELFDGGDYTYTYDGPDASDLDEAGWFYDGSTNEAFCEAHTIEVECPPELFTVDEFGERFCQWCEDHATDTHLAPLADTFENRLQWRLDRIVKRAHQDLDMLERRVAGSGGPLGEHGHIARVLERELTEIWERTCREWKPDITRQELSELRYPKPMAPGGFTGNQLGDWAVEELRGSLYPALDPERSRRIWLSIPRKPGKRTLIESLRTAFDRDRDA